MPKSRPPYPAEFRQQIVELARAGRTPTELSREFGCSAQAVANWVAQAAIDAGKPLPGKNGLSSVTGRSLEARSAESERRRRQFDKWPHTVGHLA
jgi:transposase